MTMVNPSQNPPGARTGSPTTTRQAGSDDLKHKAGSLAGEAKSEGHDKVDRMRGTAADKVDTLADSARAAASELEGDDIGHLSDYVSDLAQSLGQLSSNMREKTGDDLLHEVNRLARENPALFVTGSIAIGFGLSRFAKASTPTRGARSASDRASDTSDHTASTGRDATGARSSATTPATGTGSTPPYGSQASTRATPTPGSAPGTGRPQQPGVRP